MIRLSSTDGFKVSLEKALTDIDPNWPNYDGLLISGSHKPEDVPLEHALHELKKARESGIPTLGICFGLHLGAIEFARNVLGLTEAHSEELAPNAPVKVVTKLPGMRSGIKPVGRAQRMENHWHMYRLNPTLLHAFTSAFRLECTKDSDGEVVVEEMLHTEHSFYQFVQYHPEYGSTPDKPHPVLVAFLNACKKK